MNFRKKSASILLGVMALGFSSQMLVSAVDETSNFENKTLMAVSNDSIKDDDPLASDLKNENEGSCLSVDNTNEDVNFIYTDGLTKDESGLSKNSKTVLGAMNKLAGALAAFGGIGYAVKKFVVDKKISQNQEGPEQQVDNKKVLEENEENNNQESCNSDNAGNTEISSQDQTLEKQKSNSRNIIVPILLGVVLFVIIVVIVVTLVLKYKKKVNEFNDSGNHDEVNNNKVNNVIKDLINNEVNNNEVNNVKDLINNEVDNNEVNIIKDLINNARNNVINNVKDLINGYKDNKERLLEYLKNNKVDGNSVLSKYISDYAYDIVYYLKVLDSNDVFYITFMANSCGFDETVAIVFFCFSYYFCKNETISIFGSEPRFLACNLMKS